MLRILELFRKHPASSPSQPIGLLAVGLMLCMLCSSASADDVSLADGSRGNTSPPLHHLAFAMPLQTGDTATTGVEPLPGETVTSLEPTPLTNAEVVASEIARVTADESIDPMLRDRILASLQELAKVFASHRAASDAVAGFEKSLAQIEADKAAAKREAELPLQVSEDAHDRFLSVEDVKQRLVLANTELTAARERAQKVDEAIAQRKTRLEKLPAEITAQRRDIETIEAASVGELSDDPEGRLKHVRQSLLAAQLSAAKQRLEALLREQMLLEAQTDLLPLQSAAAKRNVRQAELVYNDWATTLQMRRQSQIKQDLTEYQKEIEDAGGDAESSQILKLKDVWVEIIGETDQAERMLAKEKIETDNWSKRLTDTQALIAESNRTGERLSSSVGLELQLMKNRLPSINRISNEITTIDRTIEKRRDLQRQLELTLQGVDDSVAGELPMEVFSERVIMGNSRSSSNLPTTEVELLGKFIGDLETHLTKLVDRRQELEELRKTVSRLDSEIDSHIVWIRNEAVFRVLDIPLAWQSFRWIMHPRHLKLLALRLGEGLWKRPDLVVVLIVALATIMWFGTRLRRRIIEHGKRAASRQTLSLQPTYATSLLSLALTLPLVVLLWIIGDAFDASSGQEPLVRAVVRALHLAAMAAFPIELLRQCLRPHGLAIAHFNTDEDSIRGLRRWLRILIDIGLPVMIVYVTTSELGRYQLTQALSRLMFISGMVLLSIVLWRTLEPKKGIFSVAIRDNPDGWLARLRHIWFLPIVWLPIIFAIISIMGYGSAAEVLIEQFYYTFWLCIVAFFIGGTTRRWLLTQRRRLAWAVHRERLEQAERLGTVGVEVEAPASMEASEISAQTSRLVSTFLAITTLIGVAWIWSPVLPAVGYLEAIRLWQSVDEKGEIVYVTLADLVKTIPIVVLTWASVRNLPGLIEGVLLERLPLEKPVRYAITTLGTYALMFLGLSMSAKTLGLRWDNIQWLVAALGVGLGFGLQEIFANFVSGLILLFEQPIRVGDIVTLGDTTGVVARIRMRATTITNWDRQELIIPNKDLITGRLVNWTLTDTTNRVVVNVGVAYGSDTDQACDLLKKICAEHSRISSDPAPNVTFEGFGDSTLNLVLRCYLADLDNRLATIHELHTMINKEFNAAGIEIAFPQRDLHLRTLPKELSQALIRSQSSDGSRQGES
ncbi:mechanosensitive ion channel domain-containing protein [Aporhodopirellula aestuarii]|uniref:Mechanosensitive ion channel n=1 Tax=Aporhodopirellula aestuarii TaxID=2950107 RepID=A0ABT0U107_9BACT|nr:mechanosensitive ion channel domain-containing protein [Aporhodopirellula aestuarii]MCM2370582.1 mechanosensitive ion channel [Aporhodopirellula aestuarii]